MSGWKRNGLDRQRRIAGDKLAQLQTLLRFAPSSTNAQRWHFSIAGTDEGKARTGRHRGRAYFVTMLRYELLLQSADGQEWRCSMPLTRWQTFTSGQTLRLKVDRFGVADCSSLISPHR